MTLATAGLEYSINAQLKANTSMYYQLKTKYEQHLEFLDEE